MNHRRLHVNAYPVKLLSSFRAPLAPNPGDAIEG